MIVTGGETILAEVDAAPTVVVRDTPSLGQVALEALARSEAGTQLGSACPPLRTDGPPDCLDRAADINLRSNSQLNQRTP